VKAISRRARKANFEAFECRTANSKYLRITADMMRSKAWAELDPFDITAYVYFKEKYHVKSTGENNARDISLTYKEMEAVMSWGRYKKSVDNLLRVGLIDLVKHRPHTRDCTIYGLSSRWHKYGQEDVKTHQRVKFSRLKEEESDEE
jgi:hypothetical protein